MIKMMGMFWTITNIILERLQVNSGATYRQPLHWKIKSNNAIVINDPINPNNIFAAAHIRNSNRKRMTYIKKDIWENCQESLMLFVIRCSRLD